MKVCLRSFGLVLITLLFNSLPLGLYADVLGDFAQTENLPGYISFDPDSAEYSLNLEEKTDLKNDDGIERRTPSEIVSSFMDAQIVSIQRLQVYMNQILKYRHDVFLNYCMRKLPKKESYNTYCLGKITDKKLEKKWAEYKYNIALTAAAEAIARAISEAQLQSISMANINTKRAQKFLSELFYAIEIVEAVKANNQDLGEYSRYVRESIKNKRNFSDNKVKISSRRTEAANLVVPKYLEKRFPHQVFLSTSNLQTLKAEGFDTSILDPMDSGFWRRPKQSIRNFNTANYNGEGINSLMKSGLSYEDAKAITDKTQVVDLVYSPDDDISGMTPKIYVKYKGQEWKLKFATNKMEQDRFINLFKSFSRFFTGFEVNTEAAVNNLAAALGFTIEPTYFKEKVRVFLPDDFAGSFEKGHEKMIQQIEKQYSVNLGISDALKYVSYDPQTGKKYIEVRSTSLEKKSDENSDMNIGFYVRHGLGKSLKREHRGFNLFLAWIIDADVKNDNDKLKIVPTVINGKVHFKLAYANADMGSSLAGGLPNYFGGPIVEEKDYFNEQLKGVTLKYQRFYPLKTLKVMTIDDAKWMARKMGQLTPGQIEKAMLGAGFPSVVAKMYTLKLLKRRNELLDALGLLGKSFINSYGEAITLNKEREWEGFVPGYEGLFEDEKLFDPQQKLFDPEKEFFYRHWGAHWNTDGYTKESMQKLMNMHLLILGLKISKGLFFDTDIYFRNNSLHLFKKMSLRGSTIEKACEGTGCFFQGISLGFNNFIPYRYIIENSDPGSEFPFLVVDVFRLGFFLHAQMDHIMQAFNMTVPNMIGLNIGIKPFLTNEYIKVRGVKKIEDLISAMDEWYNMPAIAFNDIRRKYVDKMKTGDSLVTSTYLGAEVGVGVQIPTEYTPVSPLLYIKGRQLNVHRSTLFKEKENSVVVNWSKMDQSRLKASLGATTVIPFKINIDFLTAQWEKLNTLDRVYRFDLEQEEDKDVLWNNITAITPANVPEQYKIVQRESDTNAARYVFDFFGIFHAKKYNRDSSVLFHDLISGEKLRAVTYEKGTNLKKPKKLNQETFSQRYSATVKEDGEFFAKMEVEYFHPNVKREEFKNILDRFDPILPEDFIVFDPNSTANYFGEMNVKSTIVLPKEGIDAIFGHGRDRLALCEHYAEFKKLEPQKHCSCKEWYPKGSPGEGHCKTAQVKFERKVRNLISDFLDVQRTYLEAFRFFFTADERRLSITVHDWKKEKYEDFVEDLSKFLYRDYFQVEKGDFLLSFVPKEHFYREAYIQSELEAFPGQQSKIELSRGSSGEFELGFEHRANRPDQIFEIFSDELHNLIESFFFTSDSSLI